MSRLREEEQRQSENLNRDQEGEDLLVANPFFKSEISDVDMLTSEEAPCPCTKEEGLMAEVEPVKEAVVDLGKRHNLLEDFIRVEFADKFSQFLRKREHLISLGFGGEGEGQKQELVELLRAVKDQGGGGGEISSIFNSRPLPRKKKVVPRPNDGLTPAKKSRPTPKEWLCPDCGEPTSTRKEMRAHLVAVHKPVKMFCPGGGGCGGEFFVKRRLKKHLMEEHGLGEEEVGRLADKEYAEFEEKERWLMGKLKKAKEMGEVVWREEND